ncbi:N-acetyl-D-glucosamine kinase [Toxocara canis]|uniref:N-acetyl-D-glucosamine kinase n=1 Tax=Toxocara canis TaxID=6265 RepID=A0A0B2V266_TOXCA|nr:N-acetyl-D-glucosamine kinase [Toxocara canis]
MAGNACKGGVEKVHSDEYYETHILQTIYRAHCHLRNTTALVHQLARLLWGTGDFLNANEPLLRGSTVVELGAGATGIPGIVACKCGAKLVVFTDHPSNTEALHLLKLNCAQNDLSESSFLVRGVDWESDSAVDQLLDHLQSLDFLLAADVFYDASKFELLVATVAHIIDRFPNVQCFFTYEERDSEWSVEDLLVLNRLSCSRVRKIQNNRNTIHLGVLYSSQASMNSTSFFGGIEGGATHSQLVVVDSRGRKYGEWSYEGLNYYLEGYEKVANEIALWIRGVKKELGINGPLGAVGMGLSGAEDESINKRLVGILKSQHGDVANEFFLTTDSVITIAASFNKGGVVLIAGTGSTARLLKADGTVRGVGGWGHQIGDGGSGHWIANRMIRYIFDDDDGLSPAPFPVTTVKRLLLQHFGIKNKVEILDLLYAKFEKANIASFTGRLVKGGVVLIAGTGSTARLLKADGTVRGVGGWGHQIGDGGSGHWIANRMIRYIFDDDDGLSPAPFPVTTVKRLLLQHFGIKNKVEILDLLYAKFEKANIASFTGRLVKDAPNDPLVKRVFYEAGMILGNHVRAISRHCDEEMLLDVPVVVVGSVFKSWSLLKPGFVEGVREHDKEGRIKKVTLYLLKETPAIGAALLAARSVHVSVPYQQSSIVFDVLDFH